MNIYEMRRYSTNLPEKILGNWGKYLSVLIILGTIPMFVSPSWFNINNFWGGILVLGTLVSGLLLNLATGAARQNHSVLHLSKFVIFAIAVSWFVYAIAQGVWLFSLVSIFLLMIYYLIQRIHNISVHARFAPRFFSLREFEIMLQIADAMMPENSDLHPIELSLSIDHHLYKTHTLPKKDIKRAFWASQWLLPIFSWRLAPFTALGTHERRQLINQAIASPPRSALYKLPIFRDMAKTINALLTLSNDIELEAKAVAKEK